MSPELTKLILESNLINFALVAIALIVVLVKFIPNATRKQSELIQSEIREAEAARALAENKLSELEAKLKESKSEAKKFLEEARSTAQKIRQQILDDTKSEIAQMQASAEKDLEHQKNLIMQSIKTKVIDAAFKLTEESVKSEANRKQIEASLKANLEQTLAGVKL